jgi:ATP/maltotriose-dependent transcriptional regulator MalT
MGTVYFWAGDYEQAARCYRSVVGLEARFRPLRAYSNFLVNIFINQGDLTQAKVRTEAEMHILREQGLHWATGSYLWVIHLLACFEENYQHCQQILEVARPHVHDSPDVVAWLDLMSALTACGLHEYDGARRDVQRTLRYFTQYVQSPWMLLNCVMASAVVLAHTGSKKRAVELLGLFFTHPKAAPIWKTGWAPVQRLCENLELELGTAAYDRAWTRGQALDLLATCKQLLSHWNAVPDHVHIQEKQLIVEPLSERELEVLQLVSQGLSNRVIAEQLVLTTGTIKRHVSKIGSKLGTQSRWHSVERARDLHLI